MSINTARWLINEGLAGLDIYTEDGALVTSIRRRGNEHADAIARANAHLIAAAPELLAALKGVVRVADRKTDEFDAAHAAIAKATGGDA